MEKKLSEEEIQKLLFLSADGDFAGFWDTILDLALETPENERRFWEIQKERRPNHSESSR